MFHASSAWGQQQSLSSIDWPLPAHRTFAAVVTAREDTETLTPEHLAKFYAFISCEHLRPVPCTSWTDVYNCTFREGLQLRLVHNNSKASQTVLHNLMLWIIKHK